MMMQQQEADRDRALALILSLSPLEPGHCFPPHHQLLEMSINSHADVKRMLRIYNSACILVAITKELSLLCDSDEAAWLADSSAELLAEFYLRIQEAFPDEKSNPQGCVEDRMIFIHAEILERTRHIVSEWYPELEAALETHVDGRPANPAAGRGDQEPRKAN